MSESVAAPTRYSAVQSVPIPSADVKSITGFLAFKLRDAEYGMASLRMQEIRAHEPPARIGNDPIL